MGAILGLSRLALNHCDAPELRPYLEKIYRASADLVEWLNEALESSRLEAGCTPPLEQPFDLAALIDDVRTLFAASAQAKGLQLLCEVDTGTAAAPIGDARRIKQVLCNLLSNALKFTTQGTVCLSARLQPSQPGRVLLRCRLWDTGIGIAQEDRHRLFQRYSQIANANPLPADGFGLGLAICQELLQGMGSRLELESQPGLGSCFSFTLDLACADAPAPLPANLACPPAPTPGALSAELQAQGRATQGLRVLVADDSPSDCYLLQEFLGMAGIHTVLAGNGHEVLQQLQDKAFDAILLDTQMPGMGGVEVAQCIHQLAQLAQAPQVDIIVLSAGLRPEEQQAYQAAGISLLLRKPVDPVALVRVLARRPAAETSIDPIPAQAQAQAQALAASVPATPTATATVTVSVPVTAPVLDLSRLRLQLGSNDEAIALLLSDFKSQLATQLQALEQCVATQQWAAAARVVHRLQGSAGNIGAMQMHAAADPLLLSLQAGRLHPGSLENFQAASRRAMAAMPDAPAACPAPTDAPGNPDALQRDLQALDAALVQAYFVSSQTLGAIRKNLRTDQHPLFNLICERARNLRYQEAHNLLQLLHPCMPGH
jgi:two-component system sensor histidine kinase/response regulator FitF